jgi:oligopeptide/dipeptide ABC transporter ATP-binding protein
MTITETRPAAPRGGDRGTPLLDVRGLQTSFHTRDGVVRAVTGVDFSVHRGEVMGLVGESGCGKSVTSLSILRLIAPPGRIEAGEVLFDGTDLLKLRERDMRRVRGERISMIFQHTRGLSGSVPRLGDEREELAVIPGSVPNLIDLPTGCRFAPRCLTRVEENVPYTDELHPELRPVGERHDVRCWLYHEPDGRLRS